MSTSPRVRRAAYPSGDQEALGRAGDHGVHAGSDARAGQQPDGAFCLLRPIVTAHACVAPPDTRFTDCGASRVLHEHLIACDQRSLEERDEEQEQDGQDERELDGRLPAVGAARWRRAPTASGDAHGITLSITASNMRVIA